MKYSDPGLSLLRLGFATGDYMDFDFAENELIMGHHGAISSQYIT